MNARWTNGRLVGLAAGVVLLLAAVPGCQKATGDVSGVVRYKGAPLPGGRITFLSEDKSAGGFTALLKEDGSYTIPGCPVGTAKISVETFPHSDPGSVPAGLGIKPPGGSEAVPGKFVPIPARYADPEKSGLTFPVTTGKLKHDVDLAD
jgi:hypothetical protein